MQYLFSFFVIDVLIKMFNRSMVHFLFQSISSSYWLYSKCSSCQFSYSFYNRKKFKRSGHQWPSWRHRRNRGRSYMTNVAKVKVLTRWLCHVGDTRNHETDRSPVISSGRSSNVSRIRWRNWTSYMMMEFLLYKFKRMTVQSVTT